MTAGAAPARPRWIYALLAVACFHLLTAPGQWNNTDQAEYLFTARRLLDHGTLVLGPPAGSFLPELPWVPARPGQPVKSRLLPLTAFTLVPLLAVDRLFGWEDRWQFGRVVHLQGTLLVLAALGLLGSALARAGARPLAAAAAVWLAGMSWPVWQVSRQGGAEPVMMLLLAAYARERLLGAGRPGALAVAAVALLPWANPVGSFLTVALLAWEALGAWHDGEWRARSALAGAAAAGNLSVALLWNGLYHGNWLVGGYEIYGASGYFGAMPWSSGLALYLQEAALQSGLLGAAAAACVVRSDGRAARRALLLALILSLVLLALFSTHFMPEPARRLSVVWPLWAWALGRSWPEGVRAEQALLALVAAGGALGVYWFFAVAGRYHEGPGGLFYPQAVWVRLAIAGDAALAGLAALALIVAAASALGRAFAPSPRA